MRHQYRVKAGDVIDVQRLQQETGADVTLDKVLFVGGDKTLVGAPTVNGATVTARVIKNDRARKVIVFKRKPGLYKKKKDIVNTTQVFSLQKLMMDLEMLIKLMLLLQLQRNI